MAVVTLRDIRRVAEQESVRHFHYYIGVEHLFIAMTKIKHGITNVVLEQVGIEPRFIRYTIRHEIGVNEDGRYWSGFRETPRARRVLETAQKYAGIHSPTEQHLLLAILDEGDSTPIRVLEENDVNIKDLRLIASNWSPKLRPVLPRVPIEIHDEQLELSDEERLVIERMFRQHSRVIIERELSGGFTGARLLVVEPHQVNWSEARVVVKIADRNSILHEQHHYEVYVKDTFPPTHAHLKSNPSLPEESTLGGLKYSLVTPNNRTDPVDLRAYANEVSPRELGNLIFDSIYKVYEKPLWQRHDRFRFGVWREYEHVLPAALEVEFLDLKAADSGEVLEPLGPWSRDELIETGQIVVLRDFVVNKIRYKEGRMQLTAGSAPEAVNRSSKVEVSDVGQLIKQFRRGEVIEVLVAQVRRQRKDMLRDYVLQLDPPFNVDEETIPDVLGDLPNPLFYVNEFLKRNVRGYLSLIHGDLHLGNILVGPAGDAWMIDFALVREGHALFDWAVLEISVLTTVVAPLIDDGDWEDVWAALALINKINNLQYHMDWDESLLADSLRVVVKIREIVAENLAIAGKWQEYHIALFMLALRGLTWLDTSSVQARRLLFGLASLAVVSTLDFDSGKLSTGNIGDLPTGTLNQYQDDGDPVDIFDSEGD
ncbi:MAG: phosphotransferase [Chloroflexi bacterium]|nr:phosphotransferase [Chloroflexota bacterium]